jgi:capsular polysaccharide biosynthesis protein
MYEWLHRNKSLLLALNIIGIMMLFFIHFFILTAQINPSSTDEKILQIFIMMI